MDMLIKTVEGFEKQMQKEKKLQQQEAGQVKSVMENLLKKIERNVSSTKRKRKDVPETPGGGSHRAKRDRCLEEDKPLLTHESLMVAANQVLP